MAQQAPPPPPPVEFQQLITDYPIHGVTLYSLLRIGYDETNTDILRSAALISRGDTQGLLIQENGNRQRTIGKPLRFRDWINIPYYVHYLALFCFVYATLNPEVIKVRPDKLKKIEGLVMNQEQAIGWAYCLLTYFKNDSRADIIDKYNTGLVNTTIDIIACAIANTYMERYDVRPLN